MRKLLSLLLLLSSVRGFAQQTNTDSFDLDQCIQYAYSNSPLLKQSLLDQEITEHGIKSQLSAWYPQIGFNYNLQHTFQLQSGFNNGNVIQTGAHNISYGQFGLTQNIFNSSAFLASRSAGEVRKQAQQNTVANKIDITVNVAKAYYDVLLTTEQINVLDENIVRLNQSLQDAYNQYEAGIVDKVDYKRATISLNNATAQRKSSDELLKAKYSYLKMEMGYADSVTLLLKIEKSDMETLALADTSANLALENRIEYKQLLTQKRLQELNYDYYKWQFIPTVQGYANYNLNYFNNTFNEVYQNNYPNSFVGISIGVPLFQGFRRVQNMKQAKLQSDRVNYDIDQLKLEVSTEIAQALANYKSNLIEYYNQKTNVELAQDVFNTIELQYKSGIKTYLDVITAQTDLRTAELNFTNALYQLLASKFDLEKALGTVTIN
ncbi:TolC family protein [Taibaiella lutea]|nr:TolC family protein [Taibaiella lutea]